MAVLLHKSSHKAIQNKLQILLLNPKVSGKRYGYSLNDLPSTDLTPQDRRWLTRYIELLSDDNKKKHTIVHERVLKALYKNKAVSDSFIKHCLQVVVAAQAIEDVYDTKLTVFAASDRVPYEQFLT